MQITCLTLSHIYFLQNKMYTYMLCTARQKLDFIQDNWRQTVEWRDWASELKRIKPSQWSKKGVKRNLEQMPARRNLKTRKAHLKKVLVPTDLCWGCRSISGRQLEEAWNLRLTLACIICAYRSLVLFSQATKDTLHCFTRKSATFSVFTVISVRK